jgi:hypothetical protein
MALKTYDGKLVTISWLDRTFAEGRAEQGFLKIARNAERSTFQPNAEGGGTRSISNNKSAKITMKFTQASDSHRLLMQLDALAVGSDVGAFEMRDLNGAIVERAPRAWISKRPDSEMSATSGEREWVLTTDELIREARGVMSGMLAASQTKAIGRSSTRCSRCRR